MAVRACASIGLLPLQAERVKGLRLDGGRCVSLKRGFSCRTGFGSTCSGCHLSGLRLDGLLPLQAERVDGGRCVSLKRGFSCEQCLALPARLSSVRASPRWADRCQGVRLDGGRCVSLKRGLWSNRLALPARLSSVRASPRWAERVKCLRLDGGAV